MREFVLLALASAFVPAASAQDALPIKVLSDLKASTVFVRSTIGNLEIGGSGFVMRVEGETAYIATNHHVVVPRVVRGGQKPSLTLVFNSGTKAERSVPGEILASDPQRDLAILKAVGLKDPPRPIDFSAPADLVETMPIYSFGFPFGSRLSTSKGSPAITVGRGTVSSIRTDDAGDVAVIQIDGALNPGNSGGPVVDAKGNLIGIAVARLEGAQQIGLAIPKDQLVRMLDGRVAASGLRSRRLEGGKTEVTIEVGLIDPLGRIKRVEVLYAPGDLRKDASATASGRGPLRGATRQALAISGQKATGSFSLTLPESGDRQLTFQLAFTGGTDTMVYSGPALYKPTPEVAAAPASVPTPSPSRETLAPSRPASGVARGVAPPSPRAAVPGRSGKLDPFLSVALDPRAKVAFTATQAGFLKQHGYPDFELKGSYKLPGPATQLALDAPRNRLYAVITTPQGLKIVHPSRPPEGAGNLHVYDVKALLEGRGDSIDELTPAATVPLDANVSRMILSRDGRFLHLLESTPGAKNFPARLVRVDTSRDAADLELDLAQGAEALCMPGDGKALYVAVSPKGHAAVAASEEGKIFMIDPDTYEVLKTAQIELDPADVQANDGEQVFVSGGSNQHTYIAMVDMKTTRAIVAKWRGVYMGACIRLSEDQGRLYVASRNISPASVASWALPTRPGDKPTIGKVPSGPDMPLGGEIFLAPDDGFFLTRFGAVVPLGPPKAAGESGNSATPKPRRLGPRP